MPNNLTYNSAGVNIKQSNLLIENIKHITKDQKQAHTIENIGGFAGLFELPTGYKKPVLVSSTDGVGTKLKLAFKANKHSSIGFDLVAMSVNDILVFGAKPLFFLDYYATSKLNLKTATKVIQGIYEACKQHNILLIGGETAEQPGFYHDNEYDLAGFAVGVVEKTEIPDVMNVKVGDIVIGLSSSGLHSNGYSLARKALFEVLNLKPEDRIQNTKSKLIDILLEPTIIYTKPILNLMKRKLIKIMVNITGGGLVENPPRSMPEGLGMDLQIDSWKIPSIFLEIQKAGISDQEMFKTFNMGLGFLLVISPDKLSETIILLEQLNYPHYIVGKVSKRKNNFKYTRFL